MNDIEQWTDDELDLLRLGYGGGFRDGHADANSHLDPPPTFEKFRNAHISEGFMNWLGNNRKVPKPDPLVEVLGDLEWNNNSPECAAELRAALDARGLKIVEKNDE